MWSSFVLSLACKGRHLRALVVVGEAADQRPGDAPACQLAARLCYEKLELLAAGPSPGRRRRRRSCAPGATSTLGSYTTSSPMR